MPKNKKTQPILPREEWPYEVPRNWFWTRLGNIVIIRRGASPRPIKKYITTDQSGVNWIKIGDADENKYITSTKEKIIAEGAKKSVFVQQGTLLLSNSMSFGHPYILSVDGCIHDGWLALSPNGYSNKDYLYYLLLASRWYFKQVAVGTAVRNLNSERVSLTPVPLPPLPEQKRIVTRIESLFAKLDAAEWRIKAALEKSERLRASVLHLAFTGELTQKWREEHGVGMDSWIPSTSTDLFEYVTSGSRGWAQYYSDSGAVFIRMGNLEHGTIELDMTDTQYVNLPDKAEGQRSLVQKGDILISITADVGMIGLVRDIDFEGYINQHIALARPTDKDSAEFIAWYLVSDVGLAQLRKKQRGATKVGLGLNDIRGIILNIPSKEEQREIVRILGTVFSSQKRAKEIAEKSLSRITDMKKSLLSLAFRGQLGTNNPAEESMESVLLASS